MRGFRLFLIVTGVVGLVTAILLVVLPEVPVVEAALKSRNVERLTAALALVLGTAAAFAGALATIRVADLGLVVSQRQEKMDSVSFLEARYSRSADLYSRVLLELGAVSAAGVALDEKVPHFDANKLRTNPEFLKKTMDATAPESLLAEFDYLDSALAALISALRAVACDDFSAFCFKRYLRMRPGKLDEISERLKQLGLPAAEVRVSLSDLPDVIAILEVVRRKLRGGNMGLVLQARLYANSAGIALFDIKYDHRAVRNLFFLGNLIFCRSSKLPDGRLFIASYGAAIIHDLAYGIPDSEAIRAALAERYPELTDALSSLKSDFEPANIRSTHLSGAFESSKRIGDLFLLISKESIVEDVGD